MHECPECGQACDCDGEDTWNETPADCTHWLECEDERDDEDWDDLGPDDQSVAVDDDYQDVE